MNQFDVKKISTMGWVALLFLSYSLVWVIVTGDAGFSGDEWRLLSIVYWSDLWTGIKEYFVISGRPLQMLHHLTVAEFLGFNDRVLNSLNFLTHSLSVIFFGIALRNLDPQRKPFYISAMLIVFFSPVLTTTLYRLQFSGSYVAMLFFWLSVVTIQWAIIKKIDWLWLIAPLLYGASLYAYENAILLAPVAGVMALVVYLRVNTPTIKSFAWLVVKGATVVAISYALYVLPRELLNYATHVGTREPIYLYNIYRYIITLPPYLQVPPEILNITVWGVVFTVGTGISIYALLDNTPQEHVPHKLEKNYLWFIASVCVIGGLTILFGFLPFIIASYRPTVHFGAGGRIYSSAIYGVGILLGLGYMLLSHQHRVLQIASRTFLTLWLVLWVAYHFGLSNTVRSIETQRQEIYTNWLDVVPDVASGTSFILIDFHSYQDQHAIIEGTYGIRELTKILYDDLTINSYYAYSGLTPEQMTENQVIRISEEGVIPRGRLFNEPLGFDQFIILRLEGTEISIVSEVYAGDTDVAVDWNDGITSLETSENLILDDEGQTNISRLESLGLLH